MITNSANVTISIQPAQVDAELRCRNERVLCGSTERGARMGWLTCALCIADVKKTKQPEAVRATCKSPEWCGTSKIQPPAGSVYHIGRFARYCSRDCADACDDGNPADAKRAKSNDLPPTAHDAVASPTAESGDEPSVAPLPAREWKAPTDRPWGPALYDPETSARLATTISHVAKLPDTFGTSRTPLERYNAAHRPMWSKGVDLDYLKPRWRK